MTNLVDLNALKNQFFSRQIENNYVCDGKFAFGDTPSKRDIQYFVVHFEMTEEEAVEFIKKQNVEYAQHEGDRKLWFIETARVPNHGILNKISNVWESELEQFFEKYDVRLVSEDDIASHIPYASLKESPLK